MTDTLRFGILGCGVIGSTHAEAITNLPGAQLVAVADITPINAQKLADMYNVTAYTNLQEMLDRKELDVVNICTPSGNHREHACAAMRSGRHVIVEKPMEITLPAIDEMLRVQQEMGVKLAVISQHRFDPASLQVHASRKNKLLVSSCSAMPSFPGGARRRTTTAECGAAPGHSTAEVS